jgi:hypothetical protein
MRHDDIVSVAEQVGKDTSESEMSAFVGKRIGKTLKLVEFVFPP